MTSTSFQPKISAHFGVTLSQGNHMIVRVLVFTLLFSMNAYAKPTLHATTPNQKITASETKSQIADGSLNTQLTSQNWQITQVTKQGSFSVDPDHWIFNFAANGKYKAFGTCNFLSGGYKTDEAGTFRISNLDGSNNHCSDEKDEEAIIFNMLLLADSFEMHGDTLLLKSSGQTLMELKQSDKEVSRSVAHKTKSDKSAGKSHRKKTESVSAKKPGKSKAKTSSKEGKKAHAKTDAKKSSSKKHDKKKS
jgi:heat shock protein HslJ